MTFSIRPQAAAAKESVRTLERSLSASRSQWNDATRHSFDQRHAEVLLASGLRTANELTSLAQDLANALSSLTQQ